MNERVNRQAPLPKENEQQDNISKGVSARNSQENTTAGNRYAIVIERMEEELREPTLKLQHRSLIEVVVIGSMDPKDQMTLQTNVNLNGIQNITGRGKGLLLALIGQREGRRQLPW